MWAQQGNAADPVIAPQAAATTGSGGVGWGRSVSVQDFATPPLVRESTHTITIKINTHTITEDEISSLPDALIDLRQHGILGLDGKYTEDQVCRVTIQNIPQNVEKAVNGLVFYQ